MLFRYVSRLLILCCALLFWVLGPGTAAARKPADPNRAKANSLLKAGSEKMEIGLYVEALARFKAAYKLVPSPKITYNIALANNYLTRYVEALRHFERFVSTFADHSHKYYKAARDIWIPRLKKRIATVTVQVDVAGASVTVAGKNAGRSPNIRTIRVQPEPGRLFVIVVEKPLYVQQTLQVRLAPGQRLVRRITLTTEARALAQRKEFQREQAERKRFQQRLKAEQAQARRLRLRRSRRLRITGWTLVSAGLATLLAGAVMGTISLVDKRYVENAEPERLFSDLKSRYDRSNTLRQAAWANLGIGLAIAATGGVLLWLGYRRTETQQAPPVGGGGSRISVIPVLGPRQAGMTLRMRF